MKAFPELNFTSDGEFTYSSEGMDLRDYFAAKAMQSFLLDHEAVSCENSLTVISSWSYQYADAMMEARK
jgi:hypothetical protein